MEPAAQTAGRRDPRDPTRAVGCAAMGSATERSDDGSGGVRRRLAHPAAMEPAGDRPDDSVLRTVMTVVSYSPQWSRLVISRTTRRVAHVRVAGKLAAMEPTRCDRPDDLEERSRTAGLVVAAMEPAGDRPDDGKWKTAVGRYLAAAMESAGDRPDDSDRYSQVTHWHAAPQWSRPVIGRTTARGIRAG